MQINFEEKNLELSPLLREAILEKLSSLEKFISAIRTPVEMTVEIEKTSYYRPTKKIAYRAVANMVLPGKLLRAEAEKEDVLAAVDEVKEKFKLIIEKYKGKKSAEIKKGEREFTSELGISPLAKEQETDLNSL